MTRNTHNIKDRANLERTNKSLRNAQQRQKDSFYTLYADIADELINYAPQLNNKTVYCNCDDPVQSNFVKYLTDNFKAFNLKCLIATHYIDPEQATDRPSQLTLTRTTTNAEGFIRLLSPLQSNGDFRSPECIDLLTKSDIIITNPPFSLFKEFITLILDHNKHFICLGTMHAINYQVVLDGVINNIIRTGFTNFNQELSFLVPSHYAGKPTDTEYKIAKVSVCRWTSLKVPKQTIPLTKHYTPDRYPKYDARDTKGNPVYTRPYDAINVNRLKDIPFNYTGFIGVPVTILNQLNPDQFTLHGKLNNGFVGGKKHYTRLIVKPTHGKTPTRPASPKTTIDLEKGGTPKMTKKKRVVACYARVSTSSKEQASSFENQQSFFKDFIRKSKDYTLYDIYADPGISGTLFKRKHFERMLYDAGLNVRVDHKQVIKDKELNVLSDAAEGKPSVVQYINYIIDIAEDRPPKFNEILVRNTSRFARNIEVTTILKRLRQNGVYVRFLDIDKTTENEDDIFIIQLFQNFDELFVRDLSRKVLAGNERSVANKVLRSHSKLYGYKYIPRPTLQENNSLIPIPHEAEVVQKIFRLYAGCLTPEDLAKGFIRCDFKCSGCTITKTEGLGIRRIINYLTDNGIKTRNKKSFGKTSISNILSNEKYAGYINTGKYDTGTIFNKLPSPKVRDEYLLELDPVNISEPIVSPELFYLCEAITQSRITNNRKGKSPKKSAYGGGFLVCAKCKSNYQGNTDRGVKFYQCGLKKSKGMSHCDSANVSENFVTQYLQDLLDGGLTLYLHTQYQDYLISILNAVHRRLSFIRRNRDEDRLASLIDEQSKYDKRLTNLYTRQADEEGDTTTLDNLITETKTLLSTTTIELEKYTKKPLLYLDEVTNTLLPKADDILTLLADLQSNIRQTYTEEDLGTIDHLVVHGTTQQLGGKPSPVALVPVLATDPDIDMVLSAEDSDLKTYRPLNIKPKGYTHLHQVSEDSYILKTINKKGSNALNADPTNISIYPIEILKEQYSVLSETLDTLRGLY